MNKNFFHVLVIAVVCLLATSCKKEEIKEDPKPIDKTEDIRTQGLYVSFDNGKAWKASLIYGDIFPNDRLEFSAYPSDSSGFYPHVNIIIDAKVGTTTVDTALFNPILCPENYSLIEYYNNVTVTSPYGEQFADWWVLSGSVTIDSIFNDTKIVWGSIDVVLFNAYDRYVGNIQNSNRKKLKITINGVSFADLKKNRQ